MTEFHPSILMRLHCDGELTPEQSLELRSYLEAHPEARQVLKQQAEFDRRLRAALTRVMNDGAPSAPAELVERVRSACLATRLSHSSATDEPAMQVHGGDDDHAATVSEAAHDRHHHDVAVVGAAAAAASEDIVGRLTPGGAEVVEPARQRRSVMEFIFRSPQHANAAAVAAVLVFVLAAVLLGIFGRQIDDVPPARASDLIAEAAVYADQQHHLSSAATSNIDKVAGIHDATEAQTSLSVWLGVPVTIFDLGGVGYEFVGAGYSDMPVPDRSARLVYRKIGLPNQPAPMVSIFVVPDRGDCGSMCRDMQLRKWYSCNGKADCRRKVLRTTDGSLLYFLVCCDDRDLAALSETIAQSLQLASQPGR